MRNPFGISIDDNEEMQKIWPLEMVRFWKSEAAVWMEEDEYSKAVRFLCASLLFGHLGEKSKHPGCFQTNKGVYFYV